MVKAGRISWACRGRVRRESVRAKGLVNWMRERGAGMGSRIVAPVRGVWSRDHRLGLHGWKGECFDRHC